RPRRIELLAELVPVETRFKDAGMWRVVEFESGITTGGIAGERWIKAPHRHAEGQRVAHLHVEFTTPEAANHAIDNGIFIQGKSIRVRKSDHEPRRCTRCQAYDGHLVHACKSPVNICAHCAANHRTTDCLATEADFHCGNCKVSGHTAASRECPVFARERERWRARDPTAGYRYLPTADLRTW
ncbi:hypothetical protein FB451DRAFT_947898, partial [Mycena latifolia]